MGPVTFCLGSHKNGIVPVYTRDPNNPDKTGAYGLTLRDEEKTVAQYPHSAPTSEPGDLIVIHYATIHSSGWNRSDRSRWTMQMRYFNFDHPFGAKIGWRGCFASGFRLQDVHPELVLD
jgi:ectoine hydroxylase-related dioxygenase (phytanoyl-CoA dioxygenase family)